MGIDFNKVAQGLMASALIFVFNKNTTLEHRLTSLEVGHNKTESVVKEHIDDPKLHHAIKEQLSALEKQVVVLVDRLAEIGDDLDEHESHPRLHENILVEVEKLKKEIEYLKEKLNNK